MEVGPVVFIPAGSCDVLGAAVLCACDCDAYVLQSQLPGLSWVRDNAVQWAALACVSHRDSKCICSGAVTAVICAVSHQRLEQDCFSLSACMSSRYSGPGTNPCIMDLIQADLAM